MDGKRAAAMDSKAWPFEEARRLSERFHDAPPAKGHVLFETGYGPSGLPHIGTFGEVARTTMIRRAFQEISDLPTRLICFSDDLDGMRKVPENMPNQAMLRENLQRPLTSVPDPFGEYESFGAHNNAMLRRFLDTFGFEYEFISATDFYLSGRFDTVLRRAAERYDALMEVMLASLREERQQTYSIFLPISPKSGRVLYVPLKQVNAAEGTITFDDEDGEELTLPVTGGNVKLQWKPDFGARWAALDVDFEMYGKDHSTNTPIYDSICEILGGRAPNHFTYELFLDEKGEKISKSKGNGLTIDEWLAYASPESLAYFMYGKPKTAKRMYFDVIPKAVDEYHQQLRAFAGQEPAARLANPVWHIHRGQPPASDMPVSFAMLLNLAAAAEHRRQGGALGLHPQICARRLARDASGARCGGGRRRALFRGFRAPGEGLPRRRAARGGGARRPARQAGGVGRAGGRRGAADPGVRGRQRARLRAVARLVRGDLRGAARREAGAALRRLHRGLRHSRDHRADRRGPRRAACGRLTWRFVADG